MKPSLFHALLTLDPSADAASGTWEATCSGVIRVSGDTPDKEREFHALLMTADNEPFRPGEASREVTISTTDDAATDYLTTGVAFELWSGQQPIGRGVIARRAFV
jgi:hypothetical protein